MHKLYIHTEGVHNFNAPREVVPIILDLVHPKSVLDVGCGIGTWLKVLDENGINDYLGVDGSHVNRELLKIPLSKFTEADLAGNWIVNRKFDLALCLEVAEHLPEIVADSFVDSLTQCADTIIFSAAIPGQGGQNHLNEQWPDYWQRKFERNGFYFHDVIRPLIWDNNKVDWWYRQNIFMLTKEPSSNRLMSIIHPDCFNFQVSILKNYNESVLQGDLGIIESSKILFRSIRNLLRK